MIGSPRGFTLIETLVAITVLVMAIVGPFQIAQGVLRTSYTARDELIATTLGQEAIEYIRSVRDNNYLYNLKTPGTRNWLFGFDGSTYGGVTSANCYTNACVVDAGQQTVTSCSGASCAAYPLYLSSSNLYTQVSSGNTLTRYTRTVRLTAISATETKVTVTVTWDNHGAYSVVLTEIMRDWL